MLQHVFASVKDIVYGIPEMPEPEVGMQWRINQHRAYAHYARGYIDGIASIQIVGVNDEAVEILHNSRLATFSRDEWYKYYEDNLRRPRRADTLGGGSFVPTYYGIQPVNEGFVDMLKNPPKRQLFY